MNPIFRLVSCSVIGSATAAAGWSPPDATELARLERALAPLHAEYDPAEQMVRRPFSSPGYHTTLTGGFVHPTRDALHYALGLLDTGNPEYVDRAAAIVRRVIALQDVDPASRTYGIWSWFLEEPLARMSPPDWNWADFNGMTLLQIARDHRDRLPTDLARAVDASIGHAARSIRKRNVGPGYTNIAILGTYVTLVTAELYHDDDLRAYALGRLERLHRHTQENGAFEEYNSPTYTVVALMELSRLAAHVQDPAARPMIAALVRRAWEEIARHFHAPTAQWAGPHSRAYGTLLSSGTLALIQRATAGRVDFGVDAPHREERRVPLTCPPDLEPLFQSLETPRTVTQTFVQRNGTVGTTYLHPHYALGTVNRGDFWNQRRGILMHWGSRERPGYLHVRFLKDDYDFAAAQLATAQKEGAVVAAVTFATNGGDRHVSLDRLKDGKFRARDLRLRFEFGGPAARDIRVGRPSGNRVTLHAGDLPFTIGIAHARMEATEGRLATSRERDGVQVDVVLHQGEVRDFDLTQMAEAVVAFAFSVGAHEPATHQVEGSRLTVSAGRLTTAVDVKPAPRR